MKEENIFEISQQIAEVELLNNRLMAATNLQSKLEIINSIPIVDDFLQEFPWLKDFMYQLDTPELFLLKTLIALRQGPVVFSGMEVTSIPADQLSKFISCLKEMETFYCAIGGLVGYHLTVLKLIDVKNEMSQSQQNHSAISYHEPEGIDLQNKNQQNCQAVRWGIEEMPGIAEIYPVGGAGDRLNLKDEDSGQPLPVAQLMFCGRTLLEGMIRDLQGREFLHYKLCGKQICTPLAIMTSHEKNNHEIIQQICKTNQWFGRNKSDFFFFTQILVPMITKEGLWAMRGPLDPILKPGGHGVIWKVALDQGVFKWLEDKAFDKALIRQINNPIAGIDNGLLALAGIGSHKKKKFGFASCLRLLNMPEGMDVVVEKQLQGEYEYCITNIEYTEFERCQIVDAPKSPQSPYSQYPANTNILYADLKAIKPLIENCPIPGALINMKTKVPCLSAEGEIIEQYAGRLESTMQNIADFIVDKFPKRLAKGQQKDLSTFLTYNERKKTISVTKQALEAGKPFLGTPEGCHFELMQNYYDLLSKDCHFKLPPPHDEATYLKCGPAVLADFHPALGVLYQVISQKIRGGSIAKGSEWIMEISEAEIVNLELKGSLIIEADSIMGQKSADGMISYDSANCGKCTLINVIVSNQGISPSPKNIFWKQQVIRNEGLHIHLHGNAEFFAENVHFNGNFHFEIPNGYRMIVEQKNNEIVCHTNKIESPTWMWHYTFDDHDKVVLNIDTRLKNFN